MTRLELWARIEDADGIYTHAIYDVDTDRVSWYENEPEARSHLRLGYAVPPPMTPGGRAANSHSGSKATP